MERPRGQNLGRRRFLVRLSNTSRYEATKGDLLKLKGLLAGEETVTNIRVSGEAVEFDLFTTDKSSAMMSAQKLEREVGQLLDVIDLSARGSGLPERVLVEKSLALYRHERFWEAHESLEEIWRKKPQGEEKEFLQGLILLCATYVHLQKGDTEVAARIFRRARDRLARTEFMSYLGIDADGLRKDLAKYADREIPPIVEIRKLQG